jgi:hypothetical protein
MYLGRDQMLVEEPEQELKNKEEEDIDGFLTYLVKTVDKPDHRCHLVGHCMILNHLSDYQQSRTGNKG